MENGAKLDCSKPTPAEMFFYFHKAKREKKTTHFQKIKIVRFSSIGILNNFFKMISAIYDAKIDG